jgi:hypothetical protein
MLQMRRQALSKKTAQRFSFSTSSAYEQVTAGADVEQLEFMKEMIIQVDEQDNVIGPITKKDCMSIMQDYIRY